MPPARVKRTRRGDFLLRVTTNERDVLREVAAELRELIEGGDPQDAAVRRLYPAGYLDDPERSAEYDRMVRDDLTRGRLEAIEQMVATLDSPRVSEDELAAWLGALNDARLVIGTRLDVTEETTMADLAGDPKRERMYVLYAFLTSLEAEVVDALSPG